MKKFIVYSVIEKDNGKSLTIMLGGFGSFELAVNFANLEMMHDGREIHNDHKGYATFVVPYKLDFGDGSKAVEKWVHVEPVTIY